MSDGETIPEELVLRWYPFYVFDHQAHETVKLMSYEEQGIYRALIDQQMITGSIPASEDKLARLLRMSPDMFAHAWDNIRDMFERHWDDPTRLVNMRYHKIREEQLQKCVTNTDRAKKAARKRWKNHSNGNASAVPQASSEQSTSNANIEEEKDIGGEEETTHKKPATDAAGPKDPPKKPDTWLTPFNDAWEKSFGTPFLKPGAKTGGEMGRFLKQVKGDITREGEMTEDRDIMNEMFKRFTSFLKDLGASASFARFAKTHGLYKGGGFPPNTRRGAEKKIPDPSVEKFKGRQADSPV